MTAVAHAHEVISNTRQKQLDAVDSMAPALRGCVHEFGLPIVDTCVRYGVKTPTAIRTLVKEIWAGARQLGQNTSGFNKLEWVLLQAGANLSAKTVHRILAENNMAIIGLSPTKEMIEASMAEVTGLRLKCTKEEKHKRRLTAAIRAQMKKNLGER